MYYRSPGKRFLESVLVGGALLVLFAACGSEIEEGGQLAGQRCTQGSDCAPGLVCSERRCVPGSYRSTDAGPPDTTPEDSGDTESDDGEDEPVCEVGTQTCTGPRTVQECRDGVLIERPCPVDGGQWVCRDGRCVPDRPCQDSDGDGHGEFCAEGSDCDDENPDVHSDMSEQCDTPLDDNCDGAINESCTACCAAGCTMGEFCDSCSCTSYNSRTCEHQLQPCATRGRNNGYFCADFGGGTRRCLKPCDKNQDDSTSDCTTPNSACVFGDEDRGICINGCTLEQGCGVDGLGCLPYEGKREGICVPANPDNKIGESCDPDQVLDCEPGALCVEPDTGDAVCVKACRPYAEPNATDCSSGDYCLPISDRVGVCLPDNGQSQGDSCGQERRMCGEDSVACLPEGGGSLSCQRLCRLAEGDADCSSGRECRDVRDNSEGEVGICR